jgi:hypothetical protein
MGRGGLAKVRSKNERVRKKREREMRARVAKGAQRAERGSGVAPAAATTAERPA